MIDMNRLRELTAELGFIPATTDEADIDGSPYGAPFGPPAFPACRVGIRVQQGTESR